MTDFILARKRETIALVFLIVLFVSYIVTHPSGPTTYVLTIWANQCTVLALAAIAQYFAVIVRGLDLSVGSVMALTNCVASYLVIGSTTDIIIGSIAALAIGCCCGFINGLIIVFGRVQPIVATLATSAIFLGLALLIRPTPGGEIDFDLADLMTLDVYGVPTALIIIAFIIGPFWLLLRRSGFGLALFAVGSAEQAAFQSGIPVQRVKLCAYVLGGLFAGLAGSYVGYITTTGDAGIGPNYTLNSIAAVVLGGVALRGGVGTLVGAVIGAYILKTIAAFMFFSGLPPLAQPLVEGAILAIAIALGSIGMLRVKNRLEVFK